MNKWNNKFRYQVASCWLFILSCTKMHGSMNIKFTLFTLYCENYKTFKQLTGQNKEDSNEPDSACNKNQNLNSLIFSGNGVRLADVQCFAFLCGQFRN